MGALGEVKIAPKVALGRSKSVPGVPCRGSQNQVAPKTLPREKIKQIGQKRDPKSKEFWYL